jgi:CheY-like chemotaxis protein
MEGRIRAESEVGKGSVFCDRISALPVESQHGQSASALRRSMSPEQGSWRSMTTPSIRSILIEQLTAWGFDSCAAVSGRRGPRGACGSRQVRRDVDVVILDYHMPDMDGVMTAREDPRQYRSGQATGNRHADLDGCQRSDADIRKEMRYRPHLMKPARSSLLLETALSMCLQAAAHNEKTSPNPVRKLRALV